MFKHEDHRRTLIELSPGEFKACKVLIAKEGCVVGDHHHRNKTENFLLVTGRAKRLVVGDTKLTDVNAPYEWSVPPMTYHLFELEAGSVLVGTCTTEFDPSDEISGHPSDSSSSPSTPT